MQSVGIRTILEHVNKLLVLNHSTVSQETFINTSHVNIDLITDTTRIII